MHTRFAFLLPLLLAGCAVDGPTAPSNSADVEGIVLTLPISAIVVKKRPHFLEVTRVRFSDVRVLLVGSLAVMATGCDVLSPGVCPTWVRHAIEVQVWDATSGEPAAWGATGWVQDGAFVDSLEVSGFTSYSDSSTAYAMSAAPARAGTYEVTVQKTGFKEWRASGVRVTENSCGVEPVTLKAELRSIF